MTLRVLITDAHPAFSERLVQGLGGAPATGVTCETASGPDALSMIPTCQPDVVLVNLSLPDMCGFDLIERIRVDYPHLPVLVLSSHTEDQLSVRALMLGTASYLSKDSPPEELAKVILQAMAGLATHVQESAAKPPLPASPPPHTQLTKRELQVFRMLASGQSVNEVAEALALSANTISTHKRRLMDKLGVANNAGLVRYALAHGLIE
jgi:DNA-binding NarL/FixJ family response regulator